MKWTKELHKFNSSTIKNVSFQADKPNFLKFLKMGDPFVVGAVKNLSQEKFKFTQEMAFQNFDYLEKYKGSKILIMGAGPSFKSDFDTSGYDFIWSCNHFYKHEKTKKFDIDLVTLGNENDLYDKQLHNYLETGNTIVCFENKYTKTEEMGMMKKKYPNRVFWALTRYHSRIGSVPRLACIAIALGASKIGFVGMDGFVPSSMRPEHGNSAFEPSKGPSGTIEDSSSETETSLLYKEQYLVFWDYILHDLGKNTQFFNLGHGHPCNLTTQVLSEKLGVDYQDYLSNPENRT